MAETTFRAVTLPNRSQDSLWDVSFSSGMIRSITPYDRPIPDVERPCQLLLRALCHPHVHLDKPFLLSSSCPEYRDLRPTSGSFQEALKNTAAAKSRFTKPDLLRRGEWLIVESIKAGVTDMRAFVEVDATVGLLCVEAAVELKRKWDDCCTVQICIFAQDPIFSREHAQKNRELIENALTSYPDIEALGTTPYVENSKECAISNIEWAVEISAKLNKHLDFHLDYNLDNEQEAMVWTVVKTLKEKRWRERVGKTVCLGHCTRLTLFSEEEWRSLAKEINAAQLPIWFIGLPTSDLYMMARPAEEAENMHTRVRGTLQIPPLLSDHGLNGAIGINNVGNAFTPWGTCDPLQIAMMGVGLYHGGTSNDTVLMYDSVSSAAKAAIGLGKVRDVEIGEDSPGDLLLFETGHNVTVGGHTVRLRSQQSKEEIVWSPPSIDARTTFKKGRRIELQRT